MKSKTKRIYLDYASTTPLDERVYRTMALTMKENWANPSSLYGEGAEAATLVRDSRKSIARLLNIKPEEITFTGSGTEANNTVIMGIIQAFKHRLGDKLPHIITTNIEHPSILEVCRSLEKEGSATVAYVPVESDGIVDPKKIAEALRPETVLVSVMLANNEIGTIQPLHEISKTIKEFKDSEGMYFGGDSRSCEDGESERPATTPERVLRKNTFLPNPIFLHTDASQAANYVDISFQKLGVDIMTLDGSKIYGPKGIGILAAKRYVPLEALIKGGGQEGGRRSGTENLPAIVGFSTALEISQKIREKESARLSKLRDYFFQKITSLFPQTIINGHQEKRLPNNINVCFPGTDSEFLVIKLDRLGIACSAASACMNLSGDSSSYVIESLRIKTADEKFCATSSLRFTLGRATNKAEIDLTLRALKSII